MKSLTNSSFAVRPATTSASPAPAGRFPRVPGRHHDDHRLGFPLRDQIVEDEARAPHRRPRIVAVPGPVQQIEHRILRAARFVPGRRVDLHAPERAERRRIVRDRCDRAVRHALRVHEVGARDDEEAPHVVVGFARGRVARIDRRHAVHVEVVAIGAGIDRPDHQLPHAVLTLRELRGLPQALDVARAKPHRIGLRSVDAEGDAPIGHHFGRDDRRSLRAAAAPASLAQAARRRAPPGRSPPMAPTAAP